MKIDKFKGEYDFLSNFYKTHIIYFGKKYPTSEHLFQAMKATNREDHEKKRTVLNPGLAKKYGRSISIRSDWNEIKDKVMFHACLCKFLQNGAIAIKLIETGDAYLEEGNDWDDRYWGVVNGEGRNMLGITLMKVRDILKLEKEAIGTGELMWELANTNNKEVV
jgi:ribA/ribD-fused uncharacterized protein